MLRFATAALAGAAVLACAGQASALTVTMSGVVTGGSGSDGIIHVGDPLSFTASIPDQDVLSLPSGLTGFGTYYNGRWGTPGAALTITLDGYTWTAVDDLYDGEDATVCPASGRYQDCQGGLGVILSGDQVVRLTYSDLSPVRGPRPDLLTSPDGSFVIHNYNYYGNTAVPQYFTGQFDLADAVVRAGVPEPQTWAIMLVGLFGLGAVLRSRRPARLTERRHERLPSFATERRVTLLVARHPVPAWQRTPSSSN